MGDAASVPLDNAGQFQFGPRQISGGARRGIPLALRVYESAGLVQPELREHFKAQAEAWRRRNLGPTNEEYQRQNHLYYEPRNRLERWADTAGNITAGSFGPGPAGPVRGGLITLGGAAMKGAGRLALQTIAAEGAREAVERMGGNRTAQGVASAIAVAATGGKGSNSRVNQQARPNLNPGISPRPRDWSETMSGNPHRLPQDVPPGGYPEGAFVFSDWSGFPDGVRRSNSVRVLVVGEAKKRADRLAKALRRERAELNRGKGDPPTDQHHVDPVGFGGAPDDITKLQELGRELHIATSRWYAQRYAEIKRAMKDGKASKRTRR